MARNDLRFNRFYTDGSTAYQLEPKKAPKKPASPVRQRRRKRVTVAVDFLAVWGIVVALVLLVQMMVSTVGLSKMNQEVARMEEVVSQRMDENTKLRQEYQASYDLEQIREQALEMGMIPVRQAKVIMISVADTAEPEKPQPVTFWTILMDLFA